MATTKSVGVPLPDRTLSEAPPIDKSQPKRKKEGQRVHIKTRIALAVLATMAVETTGAVITEQTNNQPLSAHTIPVDLVWPWNLTKSAVEDIHGLFKRPTLTLEERFPIVLPQENFSLVTKEEIKNLWQNTKTLDLDNYTFTEGFPFDQATIDRNPNLRMDQQFDGIFPPFIDGSKLKQEGVKNVTYYSGLQKGEDYKLIYDSEKLDASINFGYKFGITQGTAGNSFTPAYTVYAVTFRDKKTGEITKGSIAGLYAEPLIEAKPLPKDHHQVLEDGTPVKSGESIMKLTTDSQDWDGKTGEILPGQKGQFMVGTSYEQQNPMAPIPLTNRYLQTPTGNIAIEP